MVKIQLWVFYVKPWLLQLSGKKAFLLIEIRARTDISPNTNRMVATEQKYAMLFGKTRIRPGPAVKDLEKQSHNRATNCCSKKLHIPVWVTQFLYTIYPQCKIHNSHFPSLLSFSPHLPFTHRFPSCLHSVSSCHLCNTPKAASTSKPII